MRHGIVICIGVALCPAAVRGDGGTLRLSMVDGPYRLTVFTAPSPLRAGPVDISVLVQEAASGATVRDADVEIVLTPQGNEDSQLRLLAVLGAGANQLLYAAHFDLTAPGMWNAQVRVAGRPGEGAAALDLVVDERLPRWLALSPWFLWPIIPIALFSIHQRLRRRDRGRA